MNMAILALAAAALALAPDTVTLHERIDVFDPSTGRFLGSEQTWFGPDGRRLRLDITDGDGATTLLFFVLHDEQGREAEAIYFESEPEPDREVFTYSPDGRLRTTTYFYEPGIAADRTQSELDDAGREVAKRYYRANGSQYGEEDVLWDDNGNQLGWDFRYVGREGGASFRYRYEAFDAEGQWARRIRSRNGEPERIEVRTRTSSPTPAVFAKPVPFLPGRVSTGRSETSPSFSRDGRTMVFARYDDDWDRKEPFIGYLSKDGWRIEPITEIGSVYNLAISPDGLTIIFSAGPDESRSLYRIKRGEKGWSSPENLTERYRIRGTYPCLTETGDLFLYIADGVAGQGVYLARRMGDGFGEVEPIFVPEAGTTFDAFAGNTGGPLFVSRCFDDECQSGPVNGIWEIPLEGSGTGAPRKLPNLPYAWGVQPVESLGLFVFTDGDDILAVPLGVAGVSP